VVPLNMKEDVLFADPVASQDAIRTGAYGRASYTVTSWRH
jgi:hypothetical protein